MIKRTDLCDSSYGFHLAERQTLDHFDSTSEDFHSARSVSSRQLYRFRGSYGSSRKKNKKEILASLCDPSRYRKNNSSAKRFNGRDVSSTAWRFLRHLNRRFKLPGSVTLFPWRYAPGKSYLLIQLGRAGNFRYLTRYNSRAACILLFTSVFMHRRFCTDPTYLGRCEFINHLSELQLNSRRFAL
jgi:hypothetical protein